MADRAKHVLCTVASECLQLSSTTVTRLVRPFLVPLFMAGMVSFGLTFASLVRVSAGRSSRRGKVAPPARGAWRSRALGDMQALDEPHAKTPEVPSY